MRCGLAVTLLLVASVVMAACGETEIPMGDHEAPPPTGGPPHVPLDLPTEHDPEADEDDGLGLGEADDPTDGGRLARMEEWPQEWPDELGSLADDEVHGYHGELPRGEGYEAVLLYRGDYDELMAALRALADDGWDVDVRREQGSVVQTSVTVLEGFDWRIEAKALGALDDVTQLDLELVPVDEEP